MVVFKYSMCNMENNTEEFKLRSMFKHSPNGKGMIYDPNGMYPQWKRHYCPQENVASWFIAPMDKARFYKRLFFEVVIVMVKEKKIV